MSSLKNGKAKTGRGTNRFLLNTYKHFVDPWFFSSVKPKRGCYNDKQGMMLQKLKHKTAINAFNKLIQNIIIFNVIL